MRTLSLFILAAFLVIAAKVAAPIPAGSKIFIVPCGGFEVSLTAGLQSKHVPLIIVTKKEDADFLLDASSDSQPAGWAKILLFNPHSEEQASIRVINKAGEVVFAYNVDKFASFHAKQSTAEACAKHLKNAMKVK